MEVRYEGCAGKGHESNKMIIIISSSSSGSSRKLFTVFSICSAPPVVYFRVV
jgi:hypothetical protein